MGRSGTSAEWSSPGAAWFHAPANLLVIGMGAGYESLSGSAATHG